MRGNTRVKQAVDNGLLDPLFIACRGYPPRIAEWMSLWYREQDRHNDHGMAVALEVVERSAAPDTVVMFIEEVYAAPDGPTSP